MNQLPDGLVHDWHELWLSPRLCVFVSERAATVDGKRLRFSARGQYTMGRDLGGWLLTAALSDAIYQRADTRLEPVTLNDGHGGPAPDMALPTAWARQDAMLAKGPKLVGLVSGEGKDWIAHPAWTEEVAVNYGWQRPSQNGKPWQGVGVRHNPQHRDYSQLGRWVYEQCLLDEQPVQFADVLAGRHGDDLAKLCGGPLNNLVPPWARE